MEPSRSSTSTCVDGGAPPGDGGTCCRQGPDSCGDPSFDCYCNAVAAGTTCASYCADTALVDGVVAVGDCSGIASACCFAFPPGTLPGPACHCWNGPLLESCSASQGMRLTCETEGVPHYEDDEGDADVDGGIGPTMPVSGCPSPSP